MNTAAVRDYLLGLQGHIVATLQAEDGKTFRSDGWTREPGGRLEGDGLSQLVEEGNLLERGGCNFSHVKGRTLPPSATQHRPELAGAPFEALGVSLVFHPRNPYVPTVHMNVRMFAALPEGKPPVLWFGGGMDLTPYYGFEDDAAHFHRSCRDALAPFGAELQWDRRFALGVVMAAAGYPQSPRNGDPISGLPPAAEDLHVFHAGTALHDGRLLTSGGRVLCVTALGESAKLAQARAYEGLRGIHFDGAQYRTDIGHRAIKPR